MTVRKGLLGKERSDSEEMKERIVRKRQRGKEGKDNDEISAR